MSARTSVGDGEETLVFSAVLRQIGTIDVVDVHLFRVHRLVPGVLEGARVDAPDEVLHGAQIVEILETPVRSGDESLPDGRQ